MRKRLIAAVFGMVFMMGATFAFSTTSHAAFDARYYAEHNPDVVQRYGSSAAALERHYLRYGAKEGRAGDQTEAKLIESAFTKWGSKTGLAAIFDPVYYATVYPEVAALLKADPAALYNHFLTVGLANGAMPNAFVDSASYGAIYSDTSTIAENPVALLAHFATVGVTETGSVPDKKTEIAAIASTRNVTVENVTKSMAAVNGVTAQDAKEVGVDIANVKPASQKTAMEVAKSANAASGTTVIPLSTVAQTTAPAPAATTQETTTQPQEDSAEPAKEEEPAPTATTTKELVAQAKAAADASAQHADAALSKAESASKNARTILQAAKSATTSEEIEKIRAQVIKVAAEANAAYADANSALVQAYNADTFATNACYRAEDEYNYLRDDGSIKSMWSSYKQSKHSELESTVIGIQKSKESADSVLSDAEAALQDAQKKLDEALEALETLEAAASSKKTDAASKTTALMQAISSTGGDSAESALTYISDAKADYENAKLAFSTSKDKAIIVRMSTGKTAASTNRIPIQIRSLETEKSNAEDRMQQAQAEVSGLTSEIESSNSIIEECQKALAAAEADLTKSESKQEARDAREKIIDATHKIAEKEGERAVAEARQADRQAEADKNKATIDKCTEKIAELSATQIAADKAKTDAEAENTAAVNDCVEKQSTAAEKWNAYKQALQNISGLQGLSSEQIQAVIDAEEALREAEKAVEDKKDSNADLESDRDAKKDQRDGAKGQSDALQAELDAAKNQLAQASAEAKAAAEALEACQKSQDEAEKTMMDAQNAMKVSEDAVTTAKKAEETAAGAKVMAEEVQDMVGTPSTASEHPSVSSSEAMPTSDIPAIVTPNADAQ